MTCEIHCVQSEGSELIVRIATHMLLGYAIAYGLLGSDPVMVCPILPILHVVRAYGPEEVPYVCVDRKASKPCMCQLNKCIKVCIHLDVDVRWISLEHLRLVADAMCLLNTFEAAVVRNGIN